MLGLFGDRGHLVPVASFDIANDSVTEFTEKNPNLFLLWEMELCRNIYGQIFNMRSSKTLNARLPS